MLDEMYASGDKVMVSTMPQKVMNKFGEIKFMASMLTKGKIYGAGE